MLLRDIVRSRSAPIGADFDITKSLVTVKMKRHQLVPILISQGISHYHRMNKEAPIGASLFILTVLLRDIVRSRSAPIGADFDLTISLIITEGIGTNWCLFIHRILTVLLRDNIVRSRSAPIGADFDITESHITVKMKRHQLVPILI